LFSLSNQRVNQSTIQLIKYAFTIQLISTQSPSAADHAGFDYKEEVKKFLESKGLHTKDFGTSSKESVDYPDYAHPVADAVESGESSFGILFCGSANGVAITANKHQGNSRGHLLERKCFKAGPSAQQRKCAMYPCTLRFARPYV
jgi:hypothetical protein